MPELPEALQSIVSPESYHCLVWYYTAHLHELGLRVYKPPWSEDDVFFLVFQMVSYFEGSMSSWEGVDFRLGNREEFDEVAKKSHIYLPADEESLKIFLEEFPLFIIDRPDLKVRIVASRHVHKTDQQLDVVFAPPNPDSK